MLKISPKGMGTFSMNYKLHYEAIYLFPALQRAVEIAIISGFKIKPYVCEEYGRTKALDDFEVAGISDLLSNNGKICYDHTPANFNTLIRPCDRRSTIDLRKEYGKKRDNIKPIETLQTNSACKLLMETAFNQLSMSAMDYNIILELSGYIAAIDNAGVIKPEHMAEAIHYRVLELGDDENDVIPVFANS